MPNKEEPPFFNEDNFGSFHHKLPVYETMELFIETLTGTCFELRVSPFETVVCLKAKIQRLEGIPISQQHLIWNNVELQDEFSLRDYNISEGCTLKLVLSMRGGPVNTRRVALEDPIREIAEYMDSYRDDLREKASDKQVTFLVYREGDQLNFFRIVDKDGSLTPLSESLRGSINNLYTEEDDDVEASPSGQHILENAITMNKVKLLKSKMEKMNLNKKPKKKLKPRSPVTHHSSNNSVASARQKLLRVLPAIGQSCLPPVSPHPSKSSHNAPHTELDAARTRTMSPVGSKSLNQDSISDNVASPTICSIGLPPKISRVDLEGTQHSRSKALQPLASLAMEDSLTVENSSILHNNLNLFSSNDSARPITDSFTLFSQVKPDDPFGELCSLEKVSTEFGFADGNHDSPTIDAHHKTISKALNTERMQTGIVNTSELSSPRSSLLPPLHYPSQVAHNSFHKPRHPKCIELESLRPASPQRLFSSLEVHNRADASFSRTKFHGVKVESPGKRPDIISKLEAREMTDVANKATKEPVGTYSNMGFFASLARGTSMDNPHNSGNPGRFHTSAAALPVGLQHLQEETLQKTFSRETAQLLLRENRRSQPSGKALAEATPLFPPIVSSFQSKKKGVNRCHVCGRKTGLATSYECRCGNNFCASHRYAETHRCTYDYKASGRRRLQDSNPIVSAPKLPKI
ncbi:AN1-type zinc finger protein 4 isoform X2 [Bombina bombina]|uniref:AN1-type zinc finger protein 4 isoform X2 n=1 Tax=Bombina bombina TaxID=8345 RepID=UPI00235A9F6F|nr:AN1-type zinc finger protein 4 isoform X2 [Bombina bombina]